MTLYRYKYCLHGRSISFPQEGSDICVAINLQTYVLHQLHGAQSFLISYSKISLSFMEPESSLPCSQEHLHWSLSRARWITHSHPASLKSIVVLSPYRRLYFPRGLLSGVPTETVLDWFFYYPYRQPKTAYITLGSSILIRVCLKGLQFLTKRVSPLVSTS